MALNERLFNLIDETIEKFNHELSVKYSIDIDDINSVWKSVSLGETFLKVSSKAITSKAVTKPNNNSSSEEELNKLKKPELQELCRSKNLKCSGTKAELIAVLCGGSEVTKAAPKASSAKVAAKKTETPVEKRISALQQPISIRKNKFGNHTHPETSLVFDQNTKKVIGKQNENGKIDDLTPEDIDVCNQYNFQFVIPKNLDKKVNLDEVNVDELGEDVDSDVEDNTDDSINEEEILGNGDELLGEDLEEDEGEDEEFGGDDFAEYE